MLRSTAGKIAWMVRATTVVVGLSIMLALVAGAASMALGADGKPFILGQNNLANSLSRLTGDVNGSAMQIVNNNADANDTALTLRVQSGEAPMRVNSQARVANLNAAFAGQADSATSADSAQNANQLDGKSIGELPGSVVQTVPIAGNVSTTPDFGVLGFVGPTAEMTTSSTQALRGVVSAPLKVDTQNPLEFNYGLCYRAAGTNNPLILFYGGANTVRGTATTTPTSWTAAQTKVPGIAGTWQVGFCAQNNSNQFATLSGAGSANGWIEVVNPTP